MKILIIFLIVFLNSSYSYSLNIDEAIKSTIENNAKVKLALEKLEESKELVIYSSRENLPSITGTVTGTYESANTDTKLLRIMQHVKKSEINSRELFIFSPYAEVII